MKLISTELKEAVAMFLFGTTGAGTSVWVMLQNATTLFTCVAAFFGALSGAVGFYIMVRSQLRKRRKKHEEDTDRINRRD
jgi:uncharacterized membrane protein YfcA